MKRLPLKDSCEHQRIVYGGGYVLLPPSRVGPVSPPLESPFHLVWQHDVTFGTTSQEIQMHSLGALSTVERSHLVYQSQQPCGWEPRTQLGPQPGKEAFSDLPAQPCNCQLNTDSWVTPAGPAEGPAVKMDTLLLKVLKFVCVTQVYTCFVWWPRVDVQQMEVSFLSLPSHPWDRLDHIQQEGRKSVFSPVCSQCLCCTWHQKMFEESNLTL